MKKYYSRKGPKVEITKLTIAYLVTLFLLFLVYKDSPNSAIIIWIFGFLFSVFIFYAIFYAIKNKPTIIIDKHFIIDNSHLNSCGKVRWEEIKNIEIRNGGNKNFRFLCFDLIDESKILSKKNVLARFMMKSTKKKLGTIFIIPEISVNDSLETLLAEILKIKD